MYPFTRVRVNDRKTMIVFLETPLLLIALDLIIFVFISYISCISLQFDLVKSTSTYVPVLHVLDKCTGALALFMVKQIIN